MTRIKFLRNIMLFGLAIFSGIADCASNEFNLNALRSSDLSRAEQISASPLPEPQAVREWTIMAYLVGKDKKLQSMRYDTINALEILGSTDKVAIAAELGQLAWKEGDGSTWSGSKRYLIEKDVAASTAAQKIVSPALQTLPNADMGDFMHLVDFIKWAKTNYPAKRYALILEGHGSGWADRSSGKAVAFDDATGGFISTSQLASALRQTGGVEIFFTGACLMQMTEVLYEIRDYAKVAIGSEDLNLMLYNIEGVKFNAAIVPYYLSSFISGYPEFSAEQISSYFLEKVKDKWLSLGLNFPLSLSAVRLSEMDELGRRLDAWTDRAIKLNDKQAFIFAKILVLRFAQRGATIDHSRVDSNYADLADFIRTASDYTLVNSKAAGDFRKASRDLLEFINTRVVFKKVGYGKRADGADYSAAGGLSITVPPSKPWNIDTGLVSYEELTFAQGTKWDNFIFRYLWNISGDMPFVPNFELRSPTASPAGGVK